MAGRIAFIAPHHIVTTLGGMRPFSTLAMQCIGMAVPTLNGVVTGTWAQYAQANAKSKAELLKKWNDATAGINELWPKIPRRALPGGGAVTKT